MVGSSKKAQTPKAKRKAKKKEDEAKRKAEEEEEEANEAEFEKAVLEIRVKELETLNLGWVYFMIRFMFFNALEHLKKGSQY